MVQALAKHAAEESFVQRGDGSVIPYAEFCKIVGENGHDHGDNVDLTEGRVGNDGFFIPRYWGWGRKDGELFDSYTSGGVSPRKSATIVPFEPMSLMEQRAAEAAEQAYEFRAFNT